MPGELRGPDPFDHPRGGEIAPGRLAKEIAQRMGAIAPAHQGFQDLDLGGVASRLERHIRMQLIAEVLGEGRDFDRAACPRP